MTDKTYTYKYPHPAVTVDIIVSRPYKAGLQVLLIKRGKEPFKDCWALPGGHAEPNETLDAAAGRELLEETGIQPLYLTQEKTYGDPGRDPRGWYITVVYHARFCDAEPVAGDDAKEAQWFSTDNLPENLAFDHQMILEELLLK